MLPSLSGLQGAARPIPFTGFLQNQPGQQNIILHMIRDNSSPYQVAAKDDQILTI